MIQYSIGFDDGTTLDFDVDEEGETSVEAEGQEIPEWIELERFKCDRCSLSTGSRKTCPAALSIKEVVETLAARVSFEEVELRVVRDKVTLGTRISIQQAARSLIGLSIPLSACPVMMKLRPMARLHLPLGNRIHTAFRFLGMYLIAQYMKKQTGRTPDWELAGLLDLLEDIHMVNHYLTQRIRAVHQRDATVNALVGLDFFANNVEWSIEDSLEELGPLFSTILED